MSMNWRKLFFPLYLLNDLGERVKFLGTCFPITENGGFLTCRHVVDHGDGAIIGIDDNFNKVHRIRACRFHEAHDIAFFEVQPSITDSFFSVLDPKVPKAGSDVYTYGYYDILQENCNRSETNRGFFKGHIITIKPVGPNFATMLVSFPILEGLSGSPLLAYHHGVKVVGLNYGNVSSRVLAHEVVEYEDNQRCFRESIHRMVEYGRVYHAVTVINCLRELGVFGMTVSQTKAETGPAFHGIPQ